MNKTITIFLLILGTSMNVQAQQHLSRQGIVEFFSYTKVENIKATNNQAQSAIDIEKKEIVVQMLMRAFVFEKSLMQEHFNESYIESDIYPKAIFKGEILDFEPSLEGEQTRKIKGMFAMHGVTKEIEVKTQITQTNGSYTFKGSLQLKVKDFEIKVPSLLSPNIAEDITINFNIEFDTNEN